MHISNKAMLKKKFKAWDKENNCWYEPVYKAYNNELWELLLNFRGELDAHSIDNGRPILIHESMFPNRYEVIQFIGHCDKNNIEIYEGDIVQCCRYENNELFNVVIKDIRRLPQEMFGSNLNWIEVIGNIYQNKELLENL
jgi:hypothetical protein